MLNVLTRVMELKDPYLKGHSERVSDLAVRMGRVVGFDSARLENLRLAALLHDLGQVAVRESVLQKKGGLTKDEFGEIRNSVRIGAQLLEPFEYLSKVREIITHYRERMNGSGYPDGLKGDAIPLESRVLGLAEAFDALVSERPHRPAYSRREAIETLRGTVGVWFDAKIFAALERALAKTGG
jgi:HD-GYP domain-containing protein (c-di-GMP phosphodiesterase class II)